MAGPESSSSSSSKSSSSSSSSSQSTLSYSSGSSPDTPEYGWFDHKGANWEPRNGDVAYGVHYNISTFYLSPNYTLNISGWNGVNPSPDPDPAVVFASKGKLAIYANDIVIGAKAIINGKNKGYSGGGGAWYNTIGSGIGGGPVGGSAGIGNHDGGNASLNYDKYTDLYDFKMGSAGGGGGGTSLYYAAGGGGAAGGGALLLYATNRVDVYGSLLFNSDKYGNNGSEGGAGGGAVGGGGGAGYQGGGGGYGLGAGFNTTGSGGTAAGGYVEIYCQILNASYGTIDVRGTYVDHNGATQTSTNGGTIKIYAPTRTDGTYLYQGGRLLEGVNGYEWGVQNPPIDIDPNAWTGWCYKGTTTPAKTTGPYGLLRAYLGDELVSDVKDMYYPKNRAINVSTNVASGSYTIEVRGSNSASFAQSAAIPTWESYTGGMIRDWQYVQVKIQAV